MTQINFCNLPFLSIDYTNVIDFENSESRKNYFINKTLKSVEGNIKYDNERKYINVNLSIEELRNYDYLYFTNNDNIPYYYFITNIEMVTKFNSNIHIKLDVWTTYLFNYNLLPSFVDRCHVNRWNGNSPTINIEDEGIKYGDIVQIEKSKICDMEKGIIIITSSPIGKINFDEVEEGTSGTTSGNVGDFANGTVSANLVRYVKGWEGYAPYKYYDSVGVKTIGYGVTEISESDKFNQLVSNEPATEKECAQVLYDLLNTRYGTIVNNYITELEITKQNEFDALVSFVYNLGDKLSSDAGLRNAIKSKDADAIRTKWEAYSYAGGIYYSSLNKRRNEEVDIFLNNSYKFRTISKYNASGRITSSVSGDGWLPT